MEKTDNLQLRRKVVSLNYTNEAALNIATKGVIHFRNFIGKDIFKMDGSLTKRASISLTEQFIRDTEIGSINHQVAYTKFKREDDELRMVIHTSINGGSWDDRSAFTIHDSETVGIGRFEGNLLVEAKVNRKDIPADHYVDDILHQHRILEKARINYEAKLKDINYMVRDVLGIKPI